MFSIPGLSGLKALLKQVFQINPPKPMPFDFDTDAARKKLEYVNDEIDKLVIQYDKKHRQTTKHPDIIREVKIAIIDALIVLKWESLDSGERPVSVSSIESLFEDIYLRSFVNCIVSSEDIEKFSSEKHKSTKSFNELFEAKEKTEITNVLSSEKTFDDVFIDKHVNFVSSEFNTQRSEQDGSLLLQSNKKFRSPSEAVLCKIAYNNEKIKVLEAQYELLEFYMKHALCDGLSGNERLQFRSKTNFPLKTVTCEFPNETPGSLTSLFTNFNEFMFNVEKSKEALEANGMSI